MVVGFEVCNDTSLKGRSFGALVASLNKACTQYFSTVSSNNNGKDLAFGFGSNLISK